MGDVKFTRANRTAIIEALAAGASRRRACAAAGVSPRSFRRWLDYGLKRPGGNFEEFRRAALEAEARPCGVHVVDEVPTEPDAAWKFLERFEFDRAPFVDEDPAPLLDGAEPVTIQLEFPPRD